jgi:hypothetical protein
MLLQEDDCIGILGSDDKIANLKPLGDRILIRVRALLMPVMLMPVMQHDEPC